MHFLIQMYENITNTQYLMHHSLNKYENIMNISTLNVPIIP